jgi:DNA-binding transcriptional LysR family regulator
MIDLDQVRTFVTVVDCGSFGEAGTHLQIAQPTVSQHVKKLEASLGHVLIERTRAGAQITSNGARFLPFARTLLRVAARAKTALDPCGLAIGASSNIGVYILQPLLRDFQSRESSALRLDVQIGSNTETVRRLEDAEVDIGLMEWWDERPGFDARIWRHEHLVVIVPCGHSWASRKSIHKSALLEIPMIGGEPGTGTARLLQQAFGAEAQALKIGLRLGSTEAVKRAVRAGLGISITLKNAVRDEVAAGVLHAVRVRGAALSKALYSVVPSHTPSDSLARRFDAHLRKPGEPRLRNPGG